MAGIVKPFPGNIHFDFQMIFSQQGNFDELVGHQKRGKFIVANVYPRLYLPDATPVDTSKFGIISEGSGLNHEGMASDMPRDWNLQT